MLTSLKSLYSRFSQAWSDFKALATKDFKTLWIEYRTILILLGALILTLKFRQWLIDFLVSSSKQLFQSTQKQSQSDQLKEDTANKAADTLVQDAKDLPAQETPVGEDWYKKK